MSSYLITGASRGIGLELVRQLAARPHNEVSIIFATARRASPNLQELQDKHPGRVVFIPLDVTNGTTAKEAVEIVDNILDGKGLDIIINNAGISSVSSLEEMHDLEDTFAINVNGPHMVTRAFLPALRRGGKKIVNISTSMGSIAMQSTFKHQRTPSYKVSKAALNMLTVLYAQELEEEDFVVFCISPGWLQTDMGSSYADLPVEVGVRAVLDRVDNTGKEGNGRFFNIHVPGWENNPGNNQYDGKELPW